MAKIVELLKRRFAKRPTRDVAALVRPFAVPGVRLKHSATPTPCYLGGDPPLPPDRAWPTKGRAALEFLACIDLAAVAATELVPWLPPTGRLLFFYDAEHQPWGFDPAHRGRWAVVHVDGAAAPEVTATGARRFPRRYFALHEVATLPSPERPQLAGLQLTDAEIESLVAGGQSATGREPAHQIGGFPAAIQSDEMELHCQLVSKGLYCGDDSGYNDPRALKLCAGAEQWRLLLQIDSDDAAEMTWGDAGTLYFWIREPDALAGRFDDVWVVLQCY